MGSGSQEVAVTQVYLSESKHQILVWRGATRGRVFVSSVRGRSSGFWIS